MLKVVIFFILQLKGFLLLLKKHVIVYNKLNAKNSVRITLFKHDTPQRKTGIIFITNPDFINFISKLAKKLVVVYLPRSIQNIYL